MDSPEAKALAVEVAEALRNSPRFSGRGGQLELSALLRYHTSTINGALVHPAEDMSPKFIRRLATALPDEFGWAAARLQAIEYPDPGAAPPPPGSAERREVIDRIVSALEVATRELKQLGRELE